MKAGLKQKRDLKSDDLKSSNYFPRLQSDCFEAPRKYVVPYSVTDNGNEDSETAILQFPHRHGYSLDLHMLDCCGGEGGGEEGNGFRR